MQRFILIVGHILGWCVWISIMYIYREYIAGPVFGGGDDFIILMVIHIGLFYVNVLWLWPKAFRDRKKIIYRLPIYAALELLAILCAIIGLSLATGSLEFQLDKTLPAEVYISNFYHILLPISLASGASLTYYSIYRLVYLEMAIYFLRLEWRKAQLNPHLLANLLSMISGLSLRAPGRADEAMTLVKGMMRYYIANSEDGSIPLTEEVAQVRRLIHLNELGRKDALCFRFSVNGDTAGIHCIPMLLLLLAENIFRHSDLGDPQFPAVLHVDIDKGGLSIRSSNKVKKNDGQSDDNAGVGLVNLRDRLDVLYRDAYHFNQRIEDDMFYVNIGIRGIHRIGRPAFNSIIS